MASNLKYLMLQEMELAAAYDEERSSIAATETSKETPDDGIDSNYCSQKINEHPRHLIFHKNKSYPQFYVNNDPLRNNPILETGFAVPNKRLLPAADNSDAKRFRGVFESPSSSVDDISGQTSPLVTDENPGTSPSESDYLKLVVSEESRQLSSNSDSTQELYDSTEYDNSNSLHGRFFQALRIEKQRSASPAFSTSSLPVPHLYSEFSPRDNDDTHSCASDTVTVKRTSSSKALTVKELMKLQGKESPNSEENLTNTTHDNITTTVEEVSDDSDDGLEFFSIRQISNEIEDNTLDIESNQDSFQSEVPSPEEADQTVIHDYNEEDNVSKLPYTQSSGILPAIPSHKTRERSYLMGSLTKHGSLLGVDELHKYFPDRILKVFVGTWNMQRKGVPRNLDDFILPKQQEYLQDIYAVGVQESTQDQKMWEIKLQETLGVNHVLAHSVSHGALHLSVFVRRDLIWFCSSFEDDKVTTRMVSQVKTKGAVAIGFQFFGTSLLFVNSHFHSGQTKVKERLEDYNKIKEKLKLPKTEKFDAIKSSDVTARYDNVFWFGDLNFRVSLPMSIMQDEVDRSRTGTMNVKEALKSDQLRAAMKRNTTFQGFNEHRIRFRPTYKFLPGTESYAISSKPRTPSYTDRILFKSKENGSIDCSSYDSVSSLKKSDHRPVHGFFEVSIKPGRDNTLFGMCKFRGDVYEKAAKLRARGNDYQNSSSVCNIL